MMKENLNSAIKDVTKIINRGIKSGKYRSSTGSYQVFSEFEFNYDENYCSQIPTANYETKTTDDWSEAIESFSKEFNDLISEKFDGNLKLANFIIYNIFYNRKKIGSLSKRFSRFYSELSFKTSARVKVSGLGLDVDKAQFNIDGTQYIFRRMTREFIANSPVKSVYVERHHIPDITIDIIYREDKYDEWEKHCSMDRDIYDILYFLMILKTSACVKLSTGLYIGHPGDIFMSSSGGRISVPNSQSFIKKSEIREISKIFVRLKPKIRKLTPYDESSSNAQKVAFGFYHDSLVENSIQKRISYVIMGLEALFTENEPQLIRTLYTRAGKLMFDITKKDFREHIKLGYKVRSNWAHGGLKFKRLHNEIESRFGKIDTYCRDIQNMLRISIAVSIFNDDNDNFRNNIDSAMFFGIKTNSNINLPRIFFRDSFSESSNSETVDMNLKNAEHQISNANSATVS